MAITNKANKNVKYFVYNQTDDIVDNNIFFELADAQCYTEEEIADEDAIIIYSTDGGIWKRLSEPKWERLQ